MKLFAVYLGGRAPRCNTELHDVVFVAGEKIEDTYVQLMDLWFGTPRGLHLDSWMALSVVDGHKVILKETPASVAKKLYFINLGAYQPGVFTEFHANALLVAETEQEVKSKAKEKLLIGFKSVHTDDLFDVDDCIEVARVNGLYVHLEPTNEPEVLEPNNGYYIIPKPIVAQYLQQHPHREG
jgi:hypothetical protein